MIGVALSAAPIFSLAQTQQSNNQARMLLEMQQMRQEIAELRDMVERQQYQIRQMQRAQTRSALPAQQPSYPSSSYPATESSVAGSGYPVTEGGTQAGEQPQGADPNVGPNTQPGEPFYRPYVPGENTAENSQVSARDYPDSQQRPGYESGQVVEERVINAPRSSTPEYPPVYDRSVGVSSDSSSGAAPARSDQAPYPSSQSNTGSQHWQTRPTNNAEQPDVQAGQPSNRYPSQSQTSNPTVSNMPASGGVVSVPPSGPVTRPSQDYREGAAQNSGNPTAADQTASVGISSSLSEDDYYNQGFDLMKQSKFDEAVEVFQRQISAYPNGDSADDAHYWIAEAMYVTRNLDVAKKHLKTLIQDFPNSRRVPDAMLKAAYIEQQQGNQIEARILFQEIVNYHPKSDAAIAARNRLADNN